jgi:arylsulfatase A-like enzyme
MADTHFPWNRTADERASEMGFPDGLRFVEVDAQYEAQRRYYQTITRMDWQIGQVINRLKQRGLYDETLIVVISDHGCQWFEHEHDKYVGHLYEQSLLIPLVVRVPGMPGGVVSHAPVVQMDLLPLLMDVFGIRHVPPVASYTLDGLSLLPLVRGEESPQVFQRFKNRDVLLTTHYDMIGCIEQFRNKLIFDRPTGTYLLFDIEQDPLEMHNLADERPELLEHMFQRLQELVRRHRAYFGGIRASPL